MRLQHLCPEVAGGQRGEVGYQIIQTEHYSTLKFSNNDNFERYLVLFNSSLNFVIYCLVGSNFRKTLRKTVLCCFRHTELQREEVLMIENNKIENVGASSVTEMSLFDTEDEPTEDEANIEGNILLVSRC